MKSFLIHLKNLIHRWSGTIFVQLIAVFILLTVITTALSTYIVYTRANRILTRNFEEMNLEQFRKSSHNISNLIGEANKIQLSLGANAVFQAFLDSPEFTDYSAVQNAKYIFDIVNQIITNYPYIDSIFCYSDNNIIMGVDSKSNILLRSYQAENYSEASLNYDSGILKGIRKRSNTLISFGGLTKRNFIYDAYDAGSGTPDNNYVTLAKSLTHPLTLRHDVAILINLKEDVFRSFYNDSSNNSYNLTYVIDSSGTIVSHPDVLQISKASAAFSENKTQGDSGSFVYQVDNAQKQVVYYRIGGTDFFLVRETPLNLITEDTRMLKQLFAITLSLSILLAVLLSLFYIRKITNPLRKLAHSMCQIEKGNLGQTIEYLPNNEVGVLNSQFNKMSASISELIEKNKAIEEEKHTMEIKALQAQINPHFLYNTLNTLKYMAVISNAARVADGLTALGSLLRPLYSYKGAIWTIREEYDFVRNYLKLMNYRFGGSNKINFSFEEEAMDCMVLTFLLQPILENSFTHGLDNQSLPIEISISAYIRNDSVFFELKDNGVGIREDELEQIRYSLKTDGSIYGKGGIGISNVNRRIRLYFGDQFGLNIESAPGSGTTVLVHIPRLDKGSEIKNISILGGHQDVQGIDCRR